MTCCGSFSERLEWTATHSVMNGVCALLGATRGTSTGATSTATGATTRGQARYVDFPYLARYYHMNCVLTHVTPTLSCILRTRWHQEPFNDPRVAVNSISFARLHVRRTPVGCTCRCA